MSQCEERCIGHLAEVVWGNVGGHSDGDTHRTIDKKVGEPGRQDGGLLRAAVVVVLEVDGVFFNVAHHFEGEWRHFCLGVPRGGRPVVSGRSKVTLTKREWISETPRLHQAHQGIINGGVAVRVELAHDVAHNASALGKRLVGTVAAVEHCVDDSTVYRLEPVANLRQCSSDNHAHGVVEIRALHLEL